MGKEVDVKDSTRPKSGADLFCEGLECEWEELKRVLFKLPPWFRLGQFLAALGAEENLKRVVVRAESNRRAGKTSLTEGKRGKGRCNTCDAACPEALEAFSLLWFEVLDPVDRALLEDGAGLCEDQLC